MSETRMIKKYPNRRLYDTAISSYVTLEDVKRLVLDNVAVHVVDVKTQEDITHSTLLQIILDQETKGSPLFTTDILQHLIRLHGGDTQMMMQKLLEQSVSFFAHDGFLKANGEQDQWLRSLGQKLAQFTEPHHAISVNEAT